MASPNIVLIYADDMGYGDLGCYGATKIRTPNLDAMAAEGVRFTDFYVAQPVCSASRAALLTGCYPNRIGISGALDHRARGGLGDEDTIASLLKTQGYHTAAIGKWHLGHLPQFLPTRHGFDSFYGLPYSHDMWPRHPENPKAYPPLPLIYGEKVVNPDLQPADIDMLTTRYTEHAVRFIEENRQNPFFLYMAHSLPHVPLGASPKWRGSSAAGLYGDVIQEIDASVGTVLETLRRVGVERDTLVLFASDNGPWLSYGDYAGSPGPFREGKGTCWEGGIRVPCIARWPGQIRPGRVITEPAMTLDLLPTLCDITGAARPRKPYDGKSIQPMLMGDTRARSPQEAYYFYYAANQLQAIRSGHWKLILPHTYRTLGPNPAHATGGIPTVYKQVTLTAPELYDLRTDPGEKTNVAEAHPQELRRLLNLADRIRKELGEGTQTGRGQRPPGRVEPLPL